MQGGTEDGRHERRTCDRRRCDECAGRKELARGEEGLEDAVFLLAFRTLVRILNVIRIVGEKRNMTRINSETRFFCGPFSRRLSHVHGPLLHLAIILCTMRRAPIEPQVGDVGGDGCPPESRLKRPTMVFQFWPQESSLIKRRQMKWYN